MITKYSVCLSAIGGAVLGAFVRGAEGLVMGLVVGPIALFVFAALISFIPKGD